MLSKKKGGKISPISNISTIKNKVITSTSVFNIEKNSQKLELVLAYFMPVIAAKNNAVETVRTIEPGKNGKEIEYLEINLTQVLYI